MGLMCPMLANQYPEIFSIYFYYFFHFKCILLQISHKKCFFINIFILGRSGLSRDIVISIRQLYVALQIQCH